MQKKKKKEKKFDMIIWILFYFFDIQNAKNKLMIL
jgi:hypothetical protein